MTTFLAHDLQENAARMLVGTTSTPMGLPGAHTCLGVRVLERVGMSACRPFGAVNRDGGLFCLSVASLDNSAQRPEKSSDRWRAR